MGNTFDDLKELRAMLDRGEITEAEYEVVKAELLSDASQSTVNAASTRDNPPPAPPATKPPQIPTSSDQPRWYQKKWVWLVGGIVLLAALANNVGGDSRGSDTGDVSPDLSDSETSTSCESFMSAASGIAGEASDAIDIVTETSFDTSSGSMSMSTGAVLIDGAARTMRQLQVQIDRLGVPPPTARESIRLFDQALDRYEGAFEAIARGMREGDVDLINQALDTMADGTALMTSATDAIQPCP